MSTVSVRNLRRVMLPPIHVSTLDRHFVGVNVRSKSGEVGHRKVVQLLPRTVTLCARGTPGDRVSGLPEEAATAPELVAARDRGDVAVDVADSQPGDSPSLEQE